MPRLFPERTPLDVALRGEEEGTIADRVNRSNAAGYDRPKRNGKAFEMRDDERDVDLPDEPPPGWCGRP